MEEIQSPPGFSSQNPSYSSHSLESGSSVSPLRYYGVQKRNYYKIFEKDVTQLINYVFSISPPFKIVHDIMSIMRIIQFLLPCLIPAYLNFWKEGTVDIITVNIIEIFCYIIPPIETKKTSIPFLIFYDVVQLLIIFIMIISSYYFKKNAKLPGFISPFIYLYHSTFGHFFNSIVLYLICELISRLASKNLGTAFISKSVVVILISVICFIFNNFFMSIFTSQTLIFRPCSLPSATSYPQFIIYISTIFINIFFGIAVNLKKPCQITFLSLNIVIYLLSIISIFFRGGFIHLYTSNFVLSSAITGAVFTIVDLVLILMNKGASLAILFLFIIFFVLMLVVNFFILQNSDLNKLKVLDSIYADESLFSYVRNPNQFLRLAVCGIKHAHPIIISLNFFKTAIEKWPKDQYVYFLYAKFIAIYPEETITLKYIHQAIQIQKLTGISINCICDETKAILKQRESGIPSGLRQKINKIKRQTQSTKHKLGHAWDVVIRGNISEIESATLYAIESMNETNADYKHLLHEYPNNRGVTYIYGNFLDDIMADHQMAMEMYEKTKKMLHGVYVNYEDHTHKFGLEMFPSLPGSIGLLKEQTIVTSTIDAAQSIQENESKNNDNERFKEYEQLAGIKKNIDELKIPAIIGIKIIETILISFIFIIPFIFGMIFVEIYISDMQKLLPFINTLSLLRTYAYQIISFSIRHVAESLSVFRKYPIPDIDLPRTFGYSWDTKEQLEYLLPVITKELQDFAAFRKFKESNKYIQEAKSYIFDDIINYDYYVSHTNITKINTSIQGGILDFIIQTKIILSAYEINESILTSGMILNPINNISPISINIKNTMEILIEYIYTKFSDVKRIGTIVLIVVILFDIVIYIISLLTELKLINSNKREVFKCLFSIPKKVISQLDDNRYSKKKDNQAEEMNKQEDNILKVFNSSGAYNGSTSNITVLSIETIIIVCFAITCVTLFIILIIQSAEAIRNQSGHLHYISGSYSMILSSINYLNIMLFSAAGYPIPTFDFDNIYNKMTYVYERSRYYYHVVIAGVNTSNKYPFKGIMQGIQNAIGKNCSYLDLYQNKNVLLSIDNEAEVFQCTPVDMAFILIEPIISFSMIPHQTGNIEKLDPNNLMYETIWIHLISPLYELFFEPLHNEIIPSISQEIKHLKDRYIPIIAILFVIGVVLESFVYYQAFQIESYIKSVLRLILHCNPSVIFSSSKITRVLSGDFSFQQSDSLDKNNNFFDTVFTSLPDSIIIANNDMIIQSANKACKHTFGDIELVGKSIKDFFMSDEFDGNIESLFTLVDSNPTEEIAYKKDANSDVKILKASSMMACGKFIMYCKNVTQSHNYNILIQEEKQNSDMLLSTILPPSLVSRVQEGEKNISFSVQSASILFADIVNFTPWCGSLPAEKVMSTLNILFRRFDSILDKKPTMTKIKCIGDCYMAAGGIFAQINQPSVHAKEIVSFGLLAIKEIQSINDEIHENLRIRLGVNTGGPVVAGVLGIGKPTFEIIGPAINRAQQMEQNGVPMKVHISMSVYQLICGFNFKFGQRRKIECKNEMVEIYLVEP